MLRAAPLTVRRVDRAAGTSQTNLARRGFAMLPVLVGIPVFSVVVPAFNEERCIGAFLASVSRYLNSQGLPWEIVVVDDGSRDGTVRIVRRWADADDRVRLLKESHRGKGSAISRGMLAARGRWRFMADADLSVSPDDWAVFLDAARQPDAAPVIVGSREAAGARRIGEPLARHVIGRAFNRIVQMLAVRGIKDTHCGFKLLDEDAAQALCRHLTIDGFAFDVELLVLARRAGLRIQEVGVIWTWRSDSRVRLKTGAAAFIDIVRIRWRDLRGRYNGVTSHRPTAAPGANRAAS